MNRKRFKPQNDFIFKRLFGEAETKDLLIHLLNAIFLESGGKPIVDLTIIENKELTKELIDDKTGRLDIRAETIENEQINVEVQVAEQKHMEKRSLFYLGKMFVESIKAGEQYENLKKTITINLLNFSFLQTERYHSSFHLYEDRDKTQMLTDIIEIHFIEYPKFRKITKDLQNPLHRWLLFLEEKLAEDQLEELIGMDPVIKKAEDRLEWLSGDEETIRLYEAREFSKYERNSIISSAKQTGREEGMQEGLQEGLKEGLKEGMKTGIKEGERKAAKEIAQNLLSMGIDPAKVAQATGLSQQEVEQLSRDTK